LTNPIAENLRDHKTSRLAASGEEIQGVTEDRFDAAVEWATVGHGGFSAAVVGGGSGNQLDRTISGMTKRQVDNSEGV
jgi:hypothetical protein